MEPTARPSKIAKQRQSQKSRVIKQGNKAKGKNGAFQHPYDKDGHPTQDEPWDNHWNSENCLIARKFLTAQWVREP